MTRIRSVVTSVLLCALSTAASAQGSLFVTGHDPDFHAVSGNVLGSQHIIQDSIAFARTGGSGNILLVTDRVNPGGGYIDPQLGLTAAGFTFDMADNGAAGGSIKDLHTVNFSSYGAIVVASDFGGWLRQSEVDILKARETDLFSYINGGGGVVAFAESGVLVSEADAFGWLPFLVSSAGKNQGETGNTLTPFGMTLGLTNSDINGNFSHNIFTATGGMQIVDIDSSGQILSLAYHGNIGPGGVKPGPGGNVPEPGALALLGSSLICAAGLYFRRRK
jgi:hypothetical protein